jgi:hypothetical protein
MEQREGLLGSWQLAAEAPKAAAEAAADPLDSGEADEAAAGADPPAAATEGSTPLPQGRCRAVLRTRLPCRCCCLRASSYQFCVFKSTATLPARRAWPRFTHRWLSAACRKALTYGMRLDDLSATVMQVESTLVRVMTWPIRRYPHDAAAMRSERIPAVRVARQSTTAKRMHTLITLPMGQEPGRGSLRFD